MKADRVGLMGVITAVLATLVFCYLIIGFEFPAFDYASPSTELVEVSKSIGQEVGSFLWTYRLIDLIAQAFVLFAATACCVAMLKPQEERE